MNKSSRKKFISIQVYVVMITSQTMKVLVLLPFVAISASVSPNRKNKPFPYEDMFHTVTDGYSTNNEAATPKQTLRGMVFHPEYEQQIYDLIQQSDLMCCVTPDGNEGHTESTSMPCFTTVSKSTTTEPIVDAVAKHVHHVHYRNMANVFRQVLAETLLKIIESLLNIFDDPAQQQSSRPASVPNNHPSLSNSRREPVHQLPFPFTRLDKPQQKNNNINSGQPLRAPNGQLVNNYNCRYV